MAAVSARLAPCPDAVSPTALDDTTAEQAAARGEFPGPLLVLARSDFVDELQLADAAARGARGALLSLSLNGAEKTAKLADAAAAHGLEVLVRVSDAAELEAALAPPIGAAIVVVGDVDYEEAQALLAAVPAGVLAIADVPARDVRGVWRLRDMVRGRRAL